MGGFVGFCRSLSILVKVGSIRVSVGSLSILVKVGSIRVNVRRASL
jgi:hypothetical protein